MGNAATVGCTEAHQCSAEEAAGAIGLELPVACVGKTWDTTTIAEWKLLRAASDGDVKEIWEALHEGAYIETRGEGFVQPRSNAFPDEAQECTEDESTVESHGLFTFEDQPLPEACLQGQGLTPLMRAAKEGHNSAVTVLLQAGATCMARDEDGMQPLHFAASAGSEDVCKLLLAAHADPASVDDLGRDAFACLAKEFINSQTSLKEWTQLLRGPSVHAQPSFDDFFGKRL